MRAGYLVCLAPGLWLGLWLSLWLGLWLSGLGLGHLARHNTGVQQWMTWNLCSLCALLCWRWCLSCLGLVSPVGDEDRGVDSGLGFYPGVTQVCRA